MKKAIMSRFPLTLFPLLISCASAQEQQVWTHADYDPDTVAVQLRIDQAECRVSAYEAVQLPTPPAPRSSSSPTEYQIEGRSAGMSSDEMYTGSYSATLSERPVRSGNALMDGFLAGQERAQERRDQDMQRREYADALALRNDFVEACMFQRGWRIAK